MPRKNRVLFVISTLDTGGAQKVAAELSNALIEFYDIDFLLNDKDSVVFPYSGNIFSLGLKPQNDKTNLIYQFRVLVRRIWNLVKLKRNNQYIASISFLDSANIANIITGNNRCRTIATVHITPSRELNDWKHKFIVAPLSKLLYRFADSVITVSKGIEYDLVNNMGFRSDNIRTIYNFLDIGNIRKKSSEQLSNEEKSLFNGRPVVTTVGRLTRQKGQWHLIRAFSKVIKEYPEAKLIIAGEGELYDYLKELSIDMGMENNVVFMGFVTNPYKIVKASDAFVMSSLYEGLPTALIEALAVETPCISCDYMSGAREILAPELSQNKELTGGIYEGGYGMLTLVCDDSMYDYKAPLTREEALLAKAIITVLGDKQRFIPDGVTATSRFDKGNVVDNWVALLEKGKE